MKTLEKNELLANFLGWTKQDNMWIRWYGEWFDDHGNRRTDKTREVLLFDSDWNWLMPVVEKIERLGHTIVEIGWKHCRITPILYDKKSDSMQWEPMIEILGQDKLTATYKAVVEFIEWYNNQII